MASNAAVWYNECLELYFSPDEKNLRQLIIDANGNLYDNGIAQKQITTSVKYIDKDGWYAFLELPWKALGVDQPTLGCKFKFNIVRSRQGGRPEISTWGPIKTGYRDINQFGSIMLGNFLTGQGRYEEINID